jgi:hypothetical protein
MILSVENQLLVPYIGPTRRLSTSLPLQSTVETATFGSEYVAARTSSEQIIDLRCTFRYLEYLLPTLLLCLVTTNQLSTASMPFSKLNKRHNALSHKTRSCIAANILRFIHTPGIFNPADILSKHWDAPSVWKILRSYSPREMTTTSSYHGSQGLRKAHHRC